MMYSNTRLWIPLFLFSALCAPQKARAELEGVYKVQGNRIGVKVKTWGENCGPRPRSSAGGGGKAVEVRRAGAHLLIGGQHTNRCWSRNPRVQRRRGSASAGQWTLVCETPANDPRFEHGQYTVTASGQNLTFREVSQYNWRLEGDHCEATITLTRTYVRTGDLSGAEPSDPTPPQKRCQTPGPAVKLRIRPARAQVAPGERFCFRAVATDAGGCAVDADVSWTAQDLDEGVGRFGSDGCFVAGNPRGQNRGVIAAAAGDLSATARIQVADPGIGDFIAARLGDGDDQALVPSSAAAQAGRAQGIGDASAVSDDSEGWLLWILAGAAVLVALLFVMLAALFLRRSRKTKRSEGDDAEPSSQIVATAHPPFEAEKRVCPACLQEFDPETFHCPVDGTELLPSSDHEAPAQPDQAKICPKCRHGYPASTQVCPKDKVQLVPYAEWRASRLKGAEGQSSAGMICPKCSERYDQGIIFCPKDGSKLAPIN